MKIRLPHNYTPRSYHRRIYAAWEAGVKHILLVMHRRGGKTESLVSYMPLPMLRRTGNYAHVFPFRNQAKEVVWNGIGRSGQRYIEHFPVPLLAKVPNISDLMVTMVDGRGAVGSTYQLKGTDKNVNAMVGAGTCGIVWDEYSLQDPQGRDYARPIMAENDAWEVLAYTPRGENHGFDLFTYAQSAPGWHVEYLTVDDTKRDGAGEDGGPVITLEAIEEHRRELLARGVEDADALIEQEYYLSWKAPMPGAYWSKGMMAADKEGRISRVPYDPLRPVDTYWDLGTSKAHDTNTVWFVQQQGTSVLLIDYYQASNEGAAHFAQVLRERGYAYRTHYATQPDLDEASWGTGKTRQEEAKAHGLLFTGVPKQPIITGIQAVRSLLPRCYFDAEKCHKGLNALRSYRRIWDEQKKIFHDTPEHDWASHGADAFRYLALGVSDHWDGEKPPPQKREPLYAGGMASSWMA